MAITYQTEGIVEATTASSRSYTLPTGIVAGDLIVIIAAHKPAVANTGDIGPVSGYTEVTPQVFGGGYGATLGADTGNTLISAWYRVADGSEGTTRVVPFTGQNIAWVWGARLSNDTGQWSVAGATGQDTTAGSVSVTFSSNPGVTAGDYVIAALCIPTDVTTPSQFSAEAITQTGVTYGTVTEVAEPDSSGGNDIGGVIVRAPVSSGTGTAAPVLTATAGGTTTNVRGPAVFVRIRQTGTPPVAVGQALETDTAQPVGRRKVLTVGQALELDEAQPVTVVTGGGPTIVAVGQATETDVAQPVARRKVDSLGQALEGDAAQPVTRVKRRAVGQALETDAAQPVGRRKVRPLGQALEADVAQPVTRTKRDVLTQALELDVAQPIGRRKVRTLGQALETDLAQPITEPGATTVPVAQAVEVDAAQPVARRKVRTLGQALEADLAQPISRPGATTVPVGQALELDTSQPVARVKRRTLGVAVEADAPQPVTRIRARTVGVALEVDAAQPAARVKRRAVAQVLETDTAQAFTRRRARAVGQALEADSAAAVTRRRTRTVGVALEADAAQPVTRFSLVPPGGSLSTSARPASSVAAGDDRTGPALEGAGARTTSSLSTSPRDVPTLTGR